MCVYIYICREREPINAICPEKRDNHLNLTSYIVKSFHRKMESTPV